MKPLRINIDLIVDVNRKSFVRSSPKDFANNQRFICKSSLINQ